MCIINDIGTAFVPEHPPCPVRTPNPFSIGTNRNRNLIAVPRHTFEANFMYHKMFILSSNEPRLEHKVFLPRLNRQFKVNSTLVFLLLLEESCFFGPTAPRPSLFHRDPAKVVIG